MLVKYSNLDPLIRLMRYEFNYPEPMAFSLSLQLEHRGITVGVIGGGWWSNMAQSGEDRDD